MIIRNHASSTAPLFKIMRKSLTDHSQRSTAHLIDSQTLFYLVSGEKADNQILKIDVHKKKGLMGFQNLSGLDCEQKLGIFSFP